MTKKKTPKKQPPPAVTVQNCEFAGVKFDANVTSLLSDVVAGLNTTARALCDTVQLFHGVQHHNEAMLKIAKADDEMTLIANSQFIMAKEEREKALKSAMSFEWVAPSGAKVTAKKKE